MEENPTFRFRITWCAFSNINFKGATDWEETQDYETEEELLEDFHRSSGSMSEGLIMAFDASGFEWSMEVEPV